MRYYTSIFGITLLSLTLIVACGKTEEPAKAQKPTAKPQAAPAKQEAAKQETPAKEPEKKETAKLQVYDEPGMPIRTEYPDTMEAVDTGSGEGVGFIFSFKAQGNALDQANVHIFLPRGASTAVAQGPFVTGPQGLLANNGWKKDCHHKYR